MKIKAWEITLISQITSRYNINDKDELQAELYKKLLELKHKNIKAKSWKNFLAKALYNAANDYLRKTNQHNKRYISIGSKHSNEDDDIGNIVIGSNIEDIELRITLENLSPELKQLWNVLMIEDGNISKAAKRLNKPRTTINYWYKKLKDELKK